MRHFFQGRIGRNGNSFRYEWGLKKASRIANSYLDWPTGRGDYLTSPSSQWDDQLSVFTCFRGRDERGVIAVKLG